MSKTRMNELVRGFRWKEVEAALAETPGLERFRDARGRNWLHICCSVDPKAYRQRPADAVRTADVLLRAGLDPSREAFREGAWKATPVWYAVGRGRNLPLAKFLLERGADPDHSLWAAGFRDDVAAIRLLVSAGALVDPVVENETPFLGAVKASHFRAAKALLDCGADVDYRDPRGMTALHYMLKKRSDARHFRMMIAHGARGDIPNRDGVTAKEIMERKRSRAFRELAGKLRVVG